MKNVYFGKREKAMHYFLIIYDVPEDRRRTKLSKCLEGYGKRVQMSAFECWLDSKQYKKLTNRIEKITISEDNIRIYPLNSSCIVLNDDSNDYENNSKVDIYLL